MAEVISERANLRDTPSASSEVKQEISEGTIIRVLDEQLPWYVVRVGEKVGWMHGNTLKFLRESGSVADRTSKLTATPVIVERASEPERPSVDLPTITVSPTVEARTDSTPSPTSGTTLPTVNSSGTVNVRGYFRKDGTYVRPHTRRAPRRRN